MDFPILFPVYLIILLAMPPTIIILSNFGNKFLIILILVEIFEPPIIQVMGFLISQSIFEKKQNYLNLFLAIFIPVGMHGLYNFSFASTSISYQIGYVILLIFSIRAYLIFKNLRIRQRQSIIFNKRYYNISLANFINASANTLIVFLVLNYLIHLIV